MIDASNVARLDVRNATLEVLSRELMGSKESIDRPGGWMTQENAVRQLLTIGCWILERSRYSS